MKNAEPIVFIIDDDEAVQILRRLNRDGFLFEAREPPGFGAQRVFAGLNRASSV